VDRRTFVDSLADLAGDGSEVPTIDVGLVDGKRIRLDDWSIDGDCLTGRGAHGAHRYLIQAAHVVVVEVLGED
jgi:hypothetical protein